MLGILVLQSWSLVTVVVEVEFMVVSSWRQRLFLHQASQSMGILLLPIETEYIKYIVTNHQLPRIEDGIHHRHLHL